MFVCGHCRAVFHTIEGFLDHEDAEAEHRYDVAVGTLAAKS